MKIRVSAIEMASLSERGFFVRPNAVPASVCESILERLRHFSTQPARVGTSGCRRTVNERIRSDRILWLTRREEEPRLWDVFEAWRIELQETCRIVLSHFDVQFAVYRGGTTGYARHFDAVPTRWDRMAEGPVQRRITAILYLNRCEGGSLRLFLENSVEDVIPEPGLMCLFRSEMIEHQVLPVETDRYAVTAWFY